MAKSNINYNSLSASGKQQYNSFIDGANDNMVKGFWTFFAFMSMILLALSYYRISNSQDPISLVTLLDFISNHFEGVASLFRSITIPQVSVSADVPSFFQGVVLVWNNIVNILNVLGYLFSVIIKVMYTTFSVLVWILTGYVI